MSDQNRMAITNRLAQRSGFGIIIGLLVVSTLMAWGVQETFSERSVQIHRQFVLEQDLLTSLRRTLWAIGISLRDYYLDPKGDAQAYQMRLDALSEDAHRYLSQLKTVSRHNETAGELAERLDELVQHARLGAALRDDPARRFEIIRNEIVPRRDAAGRLLRDIEKATHSTLTDSEAQLRETRTGATSRLLVMLGACLFCGVLIAWFSIRHAESLEAEAAQRYQEVLTAKQQLEDLSARLMEVQEEERTRLSRELHDEIVQNLAVMKMEIVQAQALVSQRAPDARENLTRARRIADETVRSVRDISLLLRPSLLDDLGLGPALQWQTEEFTRRTGVPCQLEDHGLSDDLPEAVKTCVYRVTQEALRNCEKHSAATSVRVEVTQTETGLEVSIEDNGKGFTESLRRPSSLGLLGMRERAYAVGGTIETGNRAQGGAFIRLKLPLVRTGNSSAASGIGVPV